MIVEGFCENRSTVTCLILSVDVHSINQFSRIFSESELTNDLRDTAALVNKEIFDMDPLCISCQYLT